MDVVAFILGVTAAAVSVFCAVHRLLGGYWPAWYYGLVFAWWWPDRPDSALTIAAALIDEDEDCSKWTNGSWLSGGFRCGNLRVTKSMEGLIGDLEVNGTAAEMDSWGFYSLVKAHRAWQRRKRVVDAERANREAAEAVLRARGRA